MHLRRAEGPSTRTPRRGRVLPYAVAGAVLALASLGAGFLASPATPGSRSTAAAPARVALPGGLDAASSELVAARRAPGARGRPLPGSDRLQLSLVLPLRHERALAALLARLDETRGPRRYLTPAEFARRFGPAPSEVGVLARYLRAHGASVGTLEGMSLQVSGPIAALDSIFATSFTRLGASYYATPTPSLPARLASEVVATAGFNSLPVARSGVVTDAVANAPLSRTRSDAPQDTGAPITYGSLGSNSVPSASFWNPDALGATYGIASLVAAGDNGSGTTVGVYELEPYDPNDVASFDSYFSISSNVGDPNVMANGTASSGASAPSNITDVSISSGGSYFPVSSTDSATIDENGGDTEADLDIEEVQSQAPGAAIDVYGAANTGEGVWDEWLAMISPSSYVTQSGVTPPPVVPTTPPSIITTSWGICESDGNSTALDELFAEAAAQGQTILAASGDDGSEGCTSGGARVLGLNYPSASPDVTAIGGTANYGGGNETAWGEANTEFTGYGGGGGISTVFAEPAWQDALYPETASSSSPCAAALGTAASCRVSPDLSANAGVGENIVAGGGWTAVGGTSAAAPLVAGLLADASTACSSAGGSRTGGELAPQLAAAYAAGAEGTAFRDITTGNNDATGQYGGSKYPATTGYDLATGVGVPIAQGFVCPTITSLSEVGGAAGDVVVITGTNLADASARFGDVSATVVTRSANEMSVVVPPPSSGDVAVTVSTPFGTSAPVDFVYGSYVPGPPPPTTTTTTTTEPPPPAFVPPTTTSTTTTTTTTSPPPATTTTLEPSSPRTTRSRAAGAAGSGARVALAPPLLHSGVSRATVGEKVTLSLRLPRAGRSTVTLQLRSGRRWRSLARATSSGRLRSFVVSFLGRGRMTLRAVVLVGARARPTNVTVVTVVRGKRTSSPARRIPPAGTRRGAKR